MKVLDNLYEVTSDNVSSDFINLELPSSDTLTITTFLGSISLIPFERVSLNFDQIFVSPGRVAQSVTCLATDACLTADPGIASSIPVRSHTFVEIDHEIISTVILLPSADLIKKGCCQLQA